jgi:hypothetical protein
MRWFIVQRPDGHVVAAFRDRGEALSYCHTHDLPTTYIFEGDAKIHIKGFLGYGR